MSYTIKFKNGDIKEFANLIGANLYGADLGRANLYGADLSGADLREADLYGANLRETNLYGANLRGANLRGANLEGAKGIFTICSEKHRLILYMFNNKHRIILGCRNHSVDYWLASYKKIGTYEGYNDHEIEIYGDMIKYCSTLEIV